MQSTKRQKKVVITDSVTNKITDAKSIVITDYRGLNTSQLLELRQKLADTNAKYQIVKNTLLARALRSKGYKVDIEQLSGPTAVLYATDDEITPIKALLDYAKTTQLPKIKGGYLGGDHLTDKQIDALAKLPNKDTMRAQVVGTINMPLVSMVNVLQANLRNLVYALNAIKEKQSA